MPSKVMKLNVLHKNDVLLQASTEFYIFIKKKQHDPKRGKNTGCETKK